MNDKPKLEHVYKSSLMDSGRWAGFRPRDGDILVCTSYKAGTTWLQMICALLIHQTPDLPAPLGELSPWLDMRTAAIEVVLARLEAHRRRRVIKSHTPLDGIPYFENVTYLYCGRDPRDVFLSAQHHVANTNVEQASRMLVEQGVELTPPPPLPDDINERFRMWMTTGTSDWEEDGAPYWSHFHHAQTFWNYRHLPNIHLLHYADLKESLDGQMRRVADILGAVTDAGTWPSLVKAATFEAMKSRADRIAPDADHGVWLSNAAFFHGGSNEQWRTGLSEASLRLYEDVKRKRFDPVFAGWLERGSLAVGDPKNM